MLSGTEGGQRKAVHLQHPVPHLQHKPLSWTGYITCQIGRYELMIQSTDVLCARAIASHLQSQRNAMQCNAMRCNLCMQSRHRIDEPILAHAVSRCMVRVHSHPNPRMNTPCVLPGCSRLPWWCCTTWAAAAWQLLWRRRLGCCRCVGCLQSEHSSNAACVCVRGENALVNPFIFIQ
jgi:hypothetical protein